ncbi:MAG: ImmA/IrrE family metallo-endopeptidase [Alphaproteobacteria bacterium]|nr:ImmA/IrrE family metallo-endopeptidase [Alphaproteobacteria bacterium]
MTPDTLAQSVDGLSWRHPLPGLVVNLVGGANLWWRTRMTVAHELAHLWFDLPTWGLVISSERDSGPLYQHFQAIEQRANAFAAYLLVPPERVRRMAAGRSVDPSLLRDVSEEYGVGYETATQTVCNILGVSRSKRHDLLAQRGRQVSWMGSDHVDAQAPPSPREQLERAVAQALRQERIDPVRARVLLGLRMSEPLPRGFPLREPVLGTVQQVRNTALRELRREGRTDVLPDRVELLANGDYQVSLVSADRGAGDASPVGHRIIPKQHIAC